MAKRRHAAHLSFLRQDFSRLFLSAKLYVVIATVVLGLLTCFGGLRGYLRGSDSTVNPFELYVMSASNRLSHWIIYLGAFVLLCDAPFRYPGDTVRLLRTDRKTWLTSQLLFSAALLGFYFIIVLVFFFLLTAGYWSLSAQWSDTLLVGAAEGCSRVGIVFGIRFWPELLRRSPWSAVGLTVLLQFLMGALMTAVLFGAYLKGRPKIGLILCAVLPLLDYILLDAFDFQICRILAYVISPFSFSSLFRLRPIGEFPVLYAACYLLCISVWLLGWLLQQVKSYDFSSVE